MIVFFSTIVSVLYYLGCMQFIIRYIARFLSYVLGTSPLESLNAAGNIFIGQVCYTYSNPVYATHTNRGLGHTKTVHGHNGNVVIDY